MDNTIFPSFYQVGNALESSYEAFRFTESYGVIFQCNVKYCIGKCEPVICGVGRDNVESWGRRRRSVSSSDSDEEMTLSKEILVLDVNNESLDTANSKIDRLRRSRQCLTPLTLFAPSLPPADSYVLSEAAIRNEQCVSRTSIMALGLLCAFLVVMYVFTIVYFTRRRWETPSHLKYMR